MRRVTLAASTLVLVACAWTISNVGVAVADDRSEADKVALLDDCDPTDLAWGASGGCTLKPSQGDVTNAEFGMLLSSPLSTAVVGHPSWRFEPSYVSTRKGRTIRISNHGGRPHTFTEVQNFGGGRIPPLNQGLTPAPECLSIGTTTDIAPGGRAEAQVSPGLHKYQCCIHPWMRGAIRVK